MSRPATTARQRRFLTALLAAPTASAAAQTVGISERTARRYLADPAFRRALQERQDALLSEATRAALRWMLAALDVLASVAADEGAPAASRVAACRALLDCAIKLIETNTLSERIAELEERLEVMDGARAS